MKDMKKKYLIPETMGVEVNTLRMFAGSNQLYLKTGGSDISGDAGVGAKGGQPDMGW